MSFKPLLDVIYTIPYKSYTRIVSCFEHVIGIREEQVDVRSIDDDGTLLPYGAIYNFGEIGSYVPKAVKKKTITKEVEDLGKEFSLVLDSTKNYTVSFLETDKLIYYKIQIIKFDFKTGKKEDEFFCFLAKVNIDNLFNN